MRCYWGEDSDLSHDSKPCHLDFSSTTDLASIVGLISKEYTVCSQARLTPKKNNRSGAEALAAQKTVEGVKLDLDFMKIRSCRSHLWEVGSVALDV